MSSQPRKKVVITGGAGFIGSHLVDACIQRDFEVTVIDNLSVGRRASFSQHEKNSRFRFLQANVEDTDRIRLCFKDVDWVFHLAARSDVASSIEHPLLYHRSNVEGTLSVLEAARQAGVKRIIYSASDSCYGIPDVFPTSENAPIRPMYPCALTKWVGESYALHWATLYGLGIISLRLFDVYGPRFHTTGVEDSVIGSYLAQKASGKPLTVIGNGTQSRDFVFVEDVVEAFFAAAESELTGDVFNVGTGESTSIQRVVELLGAVDVQYIPPQAGEPEQTQASIEKIHSRLGWKAKVSLEEGVGQTLRALEAWKEAPVWTPESTEKLNRETSVGLD